MFGVVLGVGIGALIFQEDARKRVLEWAGLTIAPARSANGAVATESRVAGDVAQA